MMGQFPSEQDLLPYMYNIETGVSGLLESFGYAFSPVLVSGQVADPGIRPGRPMPTPPDSSVLKAAMGWRAWSCPGTSRAADMFRIW
jgi:hypothetical protein